MEVVDRSHAVHFNGREIADLAVRVFELSQTLKENWLAADYTAKRQILEIVCLNFRLDGTTLVCQTGKPFDALAEEPSVSSSRDDSRCTFVNETAGVGLVLGLFPQVIHFDGDAVTQLRRSSWDD